MRWEKHEGDVAGAFRAAAHVVRAEHVIPRLAAVPMEPRGALAAPDGDRITVWSSSQSAHRPRAQLAQILGREPASIRVVVPDVGGAFGSKGIDPGRDAAGRARRARARPAGPVDRGPPRELPLGAAGPRAARRGRAGVRRRRPDPGAARPDARRPRRLPAAQHADPAAHDGDAARRAATTSRTSRCSSPARAPTRCRPGPYRGAGRPEASYLIETTLDAAARELRIDPVELRRRNLVREFPYRTALGWTYDSGDFERCLDRARRADRGGARGDRSRRAATGRRHPRRRTPRSVTCWSGPASRCRSSAPAACTSAPRSTSATTVSRCSSARSPTGQGHETLFAQIAADKLGVDPERVTVRTGDTDDAGGRRRLVRQPHDGDGRLRGRGRRRRPARQRRQSSAGRASSPTRSSPAARTRRSSRSTARPARCACAGSSPSTTPGGS